MKELSLNILDIAENSVKAGAEKIDITIEETENVLCFTVSDDGCGMSKEMVSRVADPFCTSRKTRKVGMGIPFLILAAEQTGGHVDIESRSTSDYPENHGTRIRAEFKKDHIDFVPLGDIVSTVVTLIQGSPDIDFRFYHVMPKGNVILETERLKEVLGNVPLSNTEVIMWIKEYLSDQYNEIKNNCIKKGM